MLKISKFISKGVKYSCSSVLVPVPESIAKRVIIWGRKNIDDEDVYEKKGFGREDKIHITVKYGLNISDPGQVKKLVQDFGSFSIRLGKISRFTSNRDPCDVVKIDIESEELKELNRLIKNNIDNEDNYNSYEPHVTIAYVKEGKCHDLSGNDGLEGNEFDVGFLIFNSKTGKKMEIPIV